MTYSMKEMGTIFNSSPVGIYIIQEDCFRFVNFNLLRITGFSKEELKSKRTLDMVAPEDREQVKNNAVQMLKKKRKEPYEFKIVRRDGKIAFILESVTSIQYKGKQAALGYFMDITQIRRIEKKLKISEQKYCSIFNLAKEGIVIVDYSDGTIREANLEFQRQTGYFPDMLKEKKFWELHPLELQKEAQQSFFRFKENAGGIASWNLFKSRQGEIMPVEITAQHMVMEGEDVILCMIRDVSEHHAMVRTLALASEEWRKCFDTLNSVIMLIKPDFKISRANMALAQLLKMNINDIIDKQCYKLIHNTDSPPVFCPYLKAQAQGINYETEHFEKHLDRILHFSASPIKNDKGAITHCVEVICDVTASRQSEQETLRLSKDLAASFKGITTALSSLVESRDPYTAGHSAHVADISIKIGKEMGLNSDDLEGLHVCSLLHDIGKAVIPAAILNKPGKLSRHEWGLIQEHPVTAYETLRCIPFPWPVAEVVYQHHERLDGTGYPLGLHGNQTHLWAKILTVADVFDAMTSHRPYRPGLPLKDAVDEFSKWLGIKYDSTAVEALIRVLRIDGKQVPVVNPVTNRVHGITAQFKIDGLASVGFSKSVQAPEDFPDRSFPISIVELEMSKINGTQLTSTRETLDPMTKTQMSEGPVFIKDL